MVIFAPKICIPTPHSEIIFNNFKGIDIELKKKDDKKDFLQGACIFYCIFDVMYENIHVVRKQIVDA